MFCVCVGRAGLPSVRSGRLLCLCTVGMHARCSGSIARDTGVDYLNLYHLDWNTPWIWNLAARDYPDAAHIVDWYHAKQHLCAAAELLYPNQPEQAAAWVDQHSAMLYEGQAKQRQFGFTRA